MSNEDFARNPKTPPEALAMLSTSPSVAVRLLVAQNPSTPKAALRFLAADEDKSVREAVAHNPMTPYDAFSAKEAPPLPVENPLTEDDLIMDEPEEVVAAPAGTVPQPVETPLTSAEVQAAQPEPEVVNSAQPVPYAPRNLTLWQRFLEFLGFRAS